ncbi:MAG: class I SAM-dependent methyltransferase [Thermoguttaceae bacterium]
MSAVEPDLPDAALLAQQADWLAPARARLLRRLNIARRSMVLDLACGFGSVTPELVRRSGGEVVALDFRHHALTSLPQAFAQAVRICADALRLPFADDVFDLVFCQFTFLWLDPVAAIKEIRRVLRPQGVLAAIEPDYGGMIEHPLEIASRDIWISALTRAGADPLVGRKLAGLLSPPLWSTEVALLDRLSVPSAARFELLKGLPLLDAEKQTLSEIETADAALHDALRVAHLPMFIVSATAEKP